MTAARAAALGYFTFFALLFLPLPLRGQLPGNCDTWLNGVALPNYMLARASAALSGEEVGRPLYPATGVLGFGESAFGTSAIFILFKLLTGDDVRAYYGFVVTLLALDALAVFWLAHLYVRTAAAAAFAGLAFAASNYTLGNLDSPHTSFFFVAFLALYHLKRYLQDGRRRSLLLAAALGGMQAWFSAYVFLFQSAAAAALLAARRGRPTNAARADGRALAQAGALFLALALPFFAFYARSRADANFTNPWDAVFLAEVHSLEPADLWRTLENNLVYPLDRRITAAEVGRHTERMIQAGVTTLASLTHPDTVTVFGSLSTPDDVKYFVYTRRCAFLGLVLYLLAAVGVASARAARRELLVLYLGALVVSFGPLIFAGPWMWPNLTWPAYRWLDAAGALRVPCRAFAFSVLAVALSAGLGLERLAGSLRSPGRRGLACALAAALVLLENVPWPLKAFAAADLARPEPLVSRYFADKRGHVLLDLPSRPGGALYRDGDDLFEWNRELIYMNRQTYHRQHVVNGVHGYFPRTRVEAQRLIDALPAPEAFAGLRALGVDHIVYHRALELPWERGLLRKLAGSGALVTLAVSPEVTIFGFAPGPAGGTE